MGEQLQRLEKLILFQVKRGTLADYQLDAPLASLTLLPAGWILIWAATAVTGDGMGWAVGDVYFFVCWAGAVVLACLGALDSRTHVGPGGLTLDAVHCWLVVFLYILPNLAARLSAKLILGTMLYVLHLPCMWSIRSRLQFPPAAAEATATRVLYSACASLGVLLGLLALSCWHMREGGPSALAKVDALWVLAAQVAHAYFLYISWAECTPRFLPRMATFALGPNEVGALGASVVGHCLAGALSASAFVGGVALEEGTNTVFGIDSSWRQLENFHSPGWYEHVQLVSFAALVLAAFLAGHSPPWVEGAPLVLEAGQNSLAMFAIQLKKEEAQALKDDVSTGSSSESEGRKPSDPGRATFMNRNARMAEDLKLLLGRAPLWQTNRVRKEETRGPAPEEEPGAGDEDDDFWDDDNWGSSSGFPSDDEDDAEEEKYSVEELHGKWGAWTVDAATREARSEVWDQHVGLQVIFKITDEDGKLVLTRQDGTEYHCTLVSMPDADTAVWRDDINQVESTWTRTNDPEEYNIGDDSADETDMADDEELGVAVPYPWQRVESEDGLGQPYYWNVNTEETSWEKPSDTGIARTMKISVTRENKKEKWGLTMDMAEPGMMRIRSVKEGGAFDKYNQLCVLTGNPESLVTGGCLICGVNDVHADDVADPNDGQLQRECFEQMHGMLKRELQVDCEIIKHMAIVRVHVRRRVTEHCGLEIDDHCKITTVYTGGEIDEHNKRCRRDNKLGYSIYPGMVIKKLNGSTDAESMMVHLDQAKLFRFIIDRVGEAD